MSEHKHATSPENRRATFPQDLRSLVRCVAFAMAALVALSLVPAAAQSSNGDGTQGANALRTGSVTGLPIPRFVSLKADRVNMRRGPSRSHQVEWVLLRAGLPVEITAEFENWRRIRDYAGDEGWVFHTLLSGRRTVLFAPWSTGNALVTLRDEPVDDSPTVAQIGPRVLGDIVECENRWCEIDVESARGWISQDSLWGVYPGETIK